MKKNLNRIGVLILIGIFGLFYIVTSILLEKRNINKNVPETPEVIVQKSNNYDNQKEIIDNLYQEVRILYDVVNNKFKVDQENTIMVGDVIYKKITNYDEITGNIFTENGSKKYIKDLGNYFAYIDHEYYLAGNLITYQTYYFRGDNTNIYVTSADDNEINGIIYEKWTSNNKNTLATIKVVNENGRWLIDNIDILSNE